MNVRNVAINTLVKAENKLYHAMKINKILFIIHLHSSWSLE